MAYGSLDYGLGYYKCEEIGYGHIGAFYFGPIDEAFSSVPMEISAVLLQPEVTVVNSVSSTTVPFYIPIYINLLQPKAVYATQDIEVDFVGVPRAGSSPLTVDFTATVNFSPDIKDKYIVEEYTWCFDYNYTNSTCNIPWETSTTNTISHIYTGYRGQKYSVKCCAKLKLR
jgi:hypothetical protein